MDWIWHGVPKYLTTNKARVVEAGFGGAGGWWRFRAVTLIYTSPSCHATADGHFWNAAIKTILQK